MNQLHHDRTVVTVRCRLEECQSSHVTGQRRGDRVHDALSRVKIEPVHITAFRFEPLSKRFVDSPDVIDQKNATRPTAAAFEHAIPRSLIIRNGADELTLHRTRRVRLGTSEGRGDRAWRVRVEVQITSDPDEPANCLCTIVITEWES